MTICNFTSNTTDQSAGHTADYLIGRARRAEARLDALATSAEVRIAREVLDEANRLDVGRAEPVELAGMIGRLQATVRFLLDAIEEVRQ